MMTDKIFVFDTETVGLMPRNFIYDIGWVITDRFGVITKTRNFLVKEVITDGKKMMGAFFARKIFSHYIPALDNNEINLVSLNDIQETMYNDLESCTTIAAYNIGFDLAALRNTVDICNQQQEVILDDFKILCLWNFACNVLLNSSNYHKMARSHGWQSKAGNFSTTAEASYRYVTGKTDFREAHTAIEDCLIENEIMRVAFSRKQAVPYNVYNNSPWRLAQTPEQLEAMRMVRRLKQLELFETDEGTRG
jgi:DNA polymerase III epsilon subunit-like protein